MKCKTGKVCYNNWVKAEIKRGNSEAWHGKPTRVYKCKICKTFHLTTQEKQ